MALSKFEEISFFLDLRMKMKYKLEKLRIIQETNEVNLEDEINEVIDKINKIDEWIKKLENK